MAAAFVQVCAQQEDQDNAAAAYTVVMTANTTAGNRLFLLFYNEDALATAVSDSKGNTWQKCVDTTAGTGLAVNTWTCHLTSALTTSDTITVTKAAASNRPQSCSVLELSGCDTSTTAATAIRTSVTASGGHVSPQSTGTTAGSASVDDIGIAFWATNDAVTYSAQTNSYVERVDYGTLSGAVAGAVRHSIATKTITSAATQTCSATRTGGAGTNFVAGLVVFKAAAGGTAHTHAVDDAIAGTDARTTAWVATRTIADPAAGTDALSKSAKHPVADSIAGTDAQAKAANHAQADAIQGTDTQAKTVTHPQADTGTITDATARAWAAKATVADTGTVTDNVNTGGASAHTQQIDDSIQGTDAQAREWDAVRTIADPAAGTDQISKAPRHTHADPIAGTDSLTRAWAAVIQQADTGTLTDQVTTGGEQGAQHTQTIADGITGTDSFARQWDAILALADTAAFTDQFGEPPPASIRLTYTEPSTHAAHTETSRITHTERAALTHREQT